MQKISVRFINEKGAVTGTKSLPISKEKHEFDHENWTRDDAIRKFSWYLSRYCFDGLEAATYALIRLDCLGDAIKVCMKGKNPNLPKLKNLLQLWNILGLWSIPRALKENLYQFTDAIRYFAPPYTGGGLRLYRGQSRIRHENGVYGIAWTSNYEIAKRSSMLRDTPGIVVEVDASQEMIVVRLSDYIETPMTNPADSYSFEDEYLLDPRRLVGSVRVVH